MDPLNDTLDGGDVVDSRLILPDVSDGSSFSSSSSSSSPAPAISSTVYNPGAPSPPPGLPAGVIPIPLSPYWVDPQTGIIYNALAQVVSDPSQPQSGGGGPSSSPATPPTGSSSAPGSSSSGYGYTIFHSPIFWGVASIALVLLSSSSRRRR